MIIDMHLHMFPDDLAYRAVTLLSQNSGLTAFTDGTYGDTIKKLDENGIDKAVVLNIAKKPNQDKKVNDFAITFNNDKIIQFGSVHPLSDGVEAEMERLVKNNIKGIKLHPEYQGFRVDDKIADKIYKNASELGLIVAIHAGFDIAYPKSINAHPNYLCNVINKFPDLKLQLAHFGGMMFWDDVEKYLVGSNCYFDISMTGRFIEKEQAIRIIKNHGEDNILFGTDCPWENWQIMKDFVFGLKLGEEVNNKIMYKNAKKLLNI